EVGGPAHPLDSRGLDDGRRPRGLWPGSRRRGGAVRGAAALFLLAIVGTSCHGSSESPAGTMTPVTDPYQERVARMVETQIVARGVRDPRVLQAMRDVPRHLFVDPAHQAEAYEDHPLPIAGNQTISQPYIVALMTELLDLQPQDRVLEIGTGSGYQS